jgi:metal-dependent HD superfamily phosphatase/phosphodiesterase
LRLFPLRRRFRRIARQRKSETAMTYQQIRENETIRTYIRKADESLAALGYTEHSFAHVTHVAEMAAQILSALDFDPHSIELVKIAGYLHDIGNLVNRVDHSQSGAVMAFRILDKLEMPPTDIATIVTAIGNHDEGTGIPVNPVAAALILADKSDVRATRVRNRDIATFDIHDRVNYSVSHATLTTNAQNKTVTLSLQIDTQFGSVMDYFEIFLGRMILCRKAAQALGLRFVLVANGQQLL